MNKPDKNFNTNILNKYQKTLSFRKHTFNLCMAFKLGCYISTTCVFDM